MGKFKKKPDDPMLTTTKEGFRNYMRDYMRAYRLRIEQRRKAANIGFLREHCSSNS